MESFAWTSHFETGLPTVDEQHQHLVKIINRYGASLSENELVFDAMESVCAELFDYAGYHFREEEELMSQVGIDPRHFGYHMELHQGFLAEATSIHASITPDDHKVARQLLSFLVHWLAYHVLHVDQNMARQLAAIRSGSTPGEAYEAEEHNIDSSTAPLIGALSGMFQLVSDRNADLDQANKSLEAKVAKRTKALAAANLRLEELALTDSLTGLPNRRHAMRRLADLWEESLQARTPLVCIMIDADNFKEVNDNHGHDVGDTVLRDLARTLRDCLRNDDVVCRLGGDEFLLICPATNQEGGMRVALQVWETVSALRVPAGDEVWHGSISVGVASRAPNMKDYEELIRLADEGLYAAKRDGNNCVRTAS